MRIPSIKTYGIALTVAITAASAALVPVETRAQSLFQNKSIHLPDYYDTTVRAAFKRGNWEGGKRLLDEGLKHYPTVSVLNELAGRYYYHKQAYDDARYYLVKALRDDNSNVEAKQLIVNVEEETRNYSSAICYVNELLEIHPYWKGLWRRKITLYRKMKNDVEADRLLQRLCQIYPNDAQLKKDLNYRLEQRAAAERKAGDKTAAIESTRQLVSSNPKNEEYYLSLCNLLLQEGRRSEAIDVADRGVSNLPGSNRLIMKKAGILAEDSRYGEAVSFVERCMKQNHSAQLSSFFGELQADAARSAAKSDPYTLYGKVYERTKSQESLDYLLNTAISRGYYDDALTYIAAERKRKGDTEDLLYKSYIVNRRMGNTQTASNMLNRLYLRNPNNKEVADELARERLNRAMEIMNNGGYGEALPMLEFVTKNATDSEVRETAYSRIVTCNMELKRYADAEKALNEYEKLYPNATNAVLKHADILNRSGKTEAALALLAKKYNNEQDALTQAQYVNAYEEIAVPYIKKLMNLGAVSKAYQQSLQLMEIYPRSEDALRYAINASAQLKRWNEHSRLVALGRERYPEENFYVAKQAALYTTGHKYSDAQDLLLPRVTEYIGDTLLVRANSTNSSDWAMALLDRHQTNDAMEVINTALKYDSDNRLLLYTKGLIFEAKHQYDSAYVYQKYYKPGYGEEASFLRHLDGLQAKNFRNGINFEYLQGRYGEQDVLTAVASLEYTHKIDETDSYGIRFNYAGREGAAAGTASDEQQPGGTGIQLVGEWTHKFDDLWSGTASVGLANKYFPQIMASARLTRNFEHDWEGEIHASVRRIDSYDKTFRWEYTDSETSAWVFDQWDHKHNLLLNLGAGASKTIDQWWLNGRLDLFNMKSKMYANLMVQSKYFVLNDGKSCIQAMASIGSSPEASMIDYAMPGTFSRLNTQVGLGGQYRIHRNVTLGVLGTWLTYYNQVNTRTGTYENPIDGVNTTYKNLFNIDAQVLINF